MVPLPQQGSYSGTLATRRSAGCHQPLAASMAAASVSFSGASPLSCRQPRLNSGSPLVSMYSVAWLALRCALTRTSGRWVSMLGRTPPARSRKRSATASFTRRVAKFRLRSGLPCAVMSTRKLWRGVNQSSHDTPAARRYRSCSSAYGACASSTSTRCARRLCRFRRRASAQSPRTRTPPRTVSRSSPIRPVRPCTSSARKSSTPPAQGRNRVSRVMRRWPWPCAGWRWGCAGLRGTWPPCGGRSRCPAPSASRPAGCRTGACRCPRRR